MDIKTKKKVSGWLLGLLVVVSITVIGGWKWAEYSSAREAEQDQLRAQFQKEKSELALKVAAAEKAARESKSEAERLLAEKNLLEAKLADCSKPPTKHLVPRAKTAQEKHLEQKGACDGGLTKVVNGKWQCVKTVPHAHPVVVAEPEVSSFAKAIDEEVGGQAPAPARASTVAVAYVPPPPPYCPTYIDQWGMLVREGYKHDTRSGGFCRCGSPGC